MALRREITTRIIDLLKQNPQGLSITEIVRSGGINRNTAGRYLDNLLISGQVEMRHFGMAKIYSISQRLPHSSVLSISSEYVMQLDSGLRTVFLNLPFLDLMSVSEKEIMGKNIEYTSIALFFEEVFPDLLVRLKEGLAGTEFRGELHLIKQDITFFCRIAPTVFSSGQKGVSVLFEDITKRKQSEERLQESEARLRSIIRVAPIGIGVIANRIMLEVNDQFCRMTGYEAGVLVGQSTRIFYRTDEQFTLTGSQMWAQIKKTGTASVETAWKKKDGGIVDVILCSTPLNHGDLSAGFTVTALDISDRKKADDALRENEEKFRTLFNNANDMITLHGFDAGGMPGTYIEVNDVTCRRLKYSREELLNKSPKDIVAPESLNMMAQNVRSLRATGHATFEMIHLTKDRQRIPVEISAHLFDFKGKPHVLATVRDITDRKLADEKIRESERQYRLLAENSIDIISRQTPECILTYVSPAVTPVLGYAEGEVVGRSMLELIHPEDLERVKRELVAIPTQGINTKTSVFRFRHRDGHYLLFESSTKIIRDEKTGRIREFLNVSRDITGRRSGD
ncbi:PAS domain S-box protein [Methanoregula sp.]|jgi:PAS domain S-box-containing protein|uniref:PAS domain S-box protein n=1 Tax=Methanoregula sp. TaxID=2052170 RepID=UPI003C2891C1